MTNKIKFNSNLIKSEMIKQNISFEDLAKLLGCSTSNLYSTLNKDTIPCFCERTILACHILDISPLDIFKIEE